MIDLGRFFSETFLIAALIGAAVAAILGGLAWLVYWLWCHIDIVWVP